MVDSRKDNPEEKSPVVASVASSDESDPSEGAAAQGSVKDAIASRASGEGVPPRQSLSRFAAQGTFRDSERGAWRNDRDEDDAEGDEPSATLARVRVADGDTHRPFMRGILVHSLTEQGVPFEDAYEIAQAVWLQVKGRSRVTKDQLRELVSESLSELAEEAGRVSQSLGAEPPDSNLEVLGEDGRWPFNQARLQQSLLAAGLKPIQAFETVVEIERDLHDRSDRKVSRDFIRDLAANHLRERFSPETANRYLSWRSFQADDERPLILLLGGTSGVGKSTLALEVARRLGIGRVLSTDSIRDVMRMMLTAELVPTLHVSSFEAHSRLTTAVHKGADPVIEGFLEQSRTVSVGVRAVIERAIAEGTSTVLDGVSIVPGLFDGKEWAARAHVFFLLAADEDRESLHGHLVARAHGKGARASERYVRNFREIFTIQEDLLERARRFSVPVVDVQDLEGAARRVVKHVVGQLGERRAAEASAVD